MCHAATNCGVSKVIRLRGEAESLLFASTLFLSRNSPAMLKSITSAVSSAVASARGSPAPVPLGDDHCDAGRLKQYQAIANALSDAHIPVSEGDCVACDAPCADGQNGSSGNVPEVGNAWDGKTYDQYVLEKYGDLGPLPPTVDTDWESDLAGSGGPPVGRVVVISTGKSNWLRDHTVRMT